MQSTYRVAHIEANLAQITRVDSHSYQTMKYTLTYYYNFTFRIYQDEFSVLQKDDCLSLRIMSNALLEYKAVDKSTSTNFSKIDRP